MQFITEKDNGLIPQVLAAILDECVNGVTLADPDLEDMPVIYVNKAFEQLTGYNREEIIGKNCRILQGEDRNQPERYQIVQALKNRQSVELTLRNYKKDGTLFYNHLKLVPLFDKKQRLLYYLGVQYDITQQVNSENVIKALTNMLNTIPDE